MGNGHSIHIPEPKNKWDKYFAEGIFYNRPEQVLYAIEKGADIYRLQGDWCTPIHKAAVCGHHKIVKILLDAGANKDDVCFLTGRTPLHWAIGVHRRCPEIIDTVEVLLKAQANPNLQNKEGDTPLHEVINKDLILHFFFRVKLFEKLLKLLLASGARIDIRNNNGQTPLCLARAFDAKNKSKIENFLLDHQNYKLQEQSVDKEKIIESKEPPVTNSKYLPSNLGDKTKILSKPDKEIAKPCKQLTAQHQNHKLQEQSVDVKKIIKSKEPPVTNSKYLPSNLRDKTTIPSKPDEEIAKLCKQLTTQLYLLPKVKNGTFAGQYPRPKTHEANS